MPARMLATLQSDKKVERRPAALCAANGIAKVVIRSDVSAAHILQLLNRPEA